METVILKTDGMPVVLDSSFTGTNKFDPNGFLVEFNHDGIYKYYQTADFKKSDLEKMPDLEGYYRESKYLSYAQDDDETLSIKELKHFKFDFLKYKAKQGDSVTIKVVDFEAPYEFFYKEKTYNFTVQLTIDQSDVQFYKIEIYENLRVIGWKVNIPPDVVPVITEVNLSTTASGYFYSKNFGQYVNDWPVATGEKSRIKQLTTLIAFKIYYINQEIINKILTSQELSVIEAEANARAGDVNTLTGLELLVFNLKKNWGFFYAPNSDPAFIHRHSFEQILSGNPDYVEYREYYLSLSNFYAKIYPQRDLLLGFDQNTRLDIILPLLSVSALDVIPFEMRKSILRDFLKKKDVTEEDEQFIVKVVLSIDNSKSDNFLDFLISMQDGRTTTYEGIYNLLDDARLERYTVVNWFVDEQTNRKHFVYAIYELWKTSKYNLQYLPSGTMPLGDVDINPGAYFLLNMDEFNKENVLNFSTTTVSTSAELKDIEVSFQSSFAGKHIKIDTVEKTIVYEPANDEFGTIRELRLPAKRTAFGNFHMYQSISVAGYNANFDLKIPEKSNMPAFLFHYIKEYDDLADFDAGVNLAIDLTIEAVLFYFTGGVSVLKDLRYLKYVTRLGRGLRGELAAAETVQVWRGLDVGAEGFTMLAGSLFSTNNYLINVQNDPVKRHFQEKVRLLLIGLLVVSGGVALVSRPRSVKEARSILDEIDALPPGTAHGLNNDIIALLNKLVNDRAVSITLFGNRLNAMELDNVLAGYAALSDDLKLAFWNDFKLLDDIKDIGSWRKLNSAAENMDSWLDLHNIGALQEAGRIDFVSNADLVNGIKRYYEEADLKQLLFNAGYERRKDFVLKFGKTSQIDSDTFNKIAEDPTRLELMLDILENKIKTPNILAEVDIVPIVSSGLNDLFINLLRIKIKAPFKLVLQRFSFNTSYEEMFLSDLESYFRGAFFQQVTSGFNNTRKKLFQGSNKLLTKVNVYDGNVLTEVILENFLSGKKENIIKVFGANTNLPHNFVDIANYDLYKAFNLKAIDAFDQFRYNDTEMKFIYNFILNHWTKGNRFEIELKSTLEVCTNCQSYLMYLKELGRANGKSINFKIISPKDVETTKDIIDKLPKL